MTATPAHDAAPAVLRDVRPARALALIALVLALPSLVGWLFGIPRLVQPLATFPPAHVGSLIVIPLAAGALLLKLARHFRAATALAVLCLVGSLAGMLSVLRGVPLVIGGGRISLSTAILFALYAVAVLVLLTRARTARGEARDDPRRLLVVGVLAASQVAITGVLLVTQLAGLLSTGEAASLRAPLHALLASLCLGGALLQRLAQREAHRAAPPRWAPILGGATAALVVLVLWQALRERDVAEVRARGAITAAAIERAVQRQYRTVERALGRSAEYLGNARSVDDVVWNTTLPRLVEETAGLRHLVWLDSTGRMLRTSSSEALPPDVPAALAAHVRASSPAERAEAHSTAFKLGNWNLVLWTPVPPSGLGPTVLVGILDEEELLQEFVADASRKFDVRVSAGDSVLIATSSPNDPPVFTAPLPLGARELTLSVVARAGAVHNVLPDVMLVLGLAVALLIGVTLWLQRRVWEQASAEGKSQMQAALDGVTDGVWELDVTRGVAAGRLSRSPALIRYLGFEPSALDGTFAAWTARVHADDVPRLRDALDAHLRGEKDAFECEYRVQAGDGSWHTLVDRGRAVEWRDDGTPARILGISADVTQRRRTDAMLREISALTTMGQLAARVAHEINNPLAGIQNAFLLVRGAIPDTHPHYRFVGAIEREIARIAAVTRQLYETYRPDELMARESSVILAVSDAVTFLEQVNRGRQVRIVTDVSRAPSVVPVPDALLRQTLYNLVQNAMDASPPNGTITVTAELEHEACVLRVRDEGSGVPEALRERIFDPFFSTKDRTVKTSGMGIGLALVRQSVLAIGGRIDVHDRETGGTEFEVRFPMTPLETGAMR